LLGVCDTIAVCCRGEVVAVKPAAEWNEQALISAAIGQSAEGEATGADEREL
jgi:hypothetical protein